MRALINGVLGSKNVMLLASSNWCLFDDYAFECFSKFDYVDCCCDVAVALMMVKAVYWVHFCEDLVNRLENITTNT